MRNLSVLDKLIIEALTEETDGATVDTILEYIGTSTGWKKEKRAGKVQGALFKMHTVYIDRWILTPEGDYDAVWMMVVVPPHCPKPDKV